MERATFLNDISARQQEAESALVRGDVGPRLEMWSHHDPVSVFGAVGMSKSGWDQLLPAFRAVAARLSGGRDVTFEVMSFDMSHDMAWTAGFTRFTGSLDGEPARRIALRLTHIYRREANVWKIVHEHSDFVPADESASS
jgi:ketosteroid isomerase-like protein